MFSRILIITKPLIFDFDHCDMQFSRYMQRMFPSAVEIKGFEPLTPCLQGRCSPN